MKRALQALMLAVVVALTGSWLAGCAPVIVAAGVGGAAMVATDRRHFRH